MGVMGVLGVNIFLVVARTDPEASSASGREWELQPARSAGTDALG